MLIRTVDTPEAARALLAELYTVEEPVGMDCETIGCDPRKQSPIGNAKLFCWSLAWADQAVFLPYWLPEHAALLEILRPWLEDPARAKVGHNVITYDNHVFANEGVQLAGLHDTLRMSRLLDARADAGHGLKHLMATRLGLHQMSFEALTHVAKPGHPGKYKKVCRTSANRLVGGAYQKISFPKKPYCVDLQTLIDRHPDRLPWLVQYATQDAVGTYRLCPILRQALERVQTPYKRTLWAGYSDTWLPFCRLLARLEARGVPFSVPEARRLATAGTKELQLARTTLPELNWASPNQRRKYLFGELGLPRPPVKGTKRAISASEPREWSTSAASLLWLRLERPDHNDLIVNIERADRLRKALAYATELPKYVQHGRIHCVLAPETETYRLSARCPALQQIPNSAQVPIRRAFAAGLGQKLVVLDFSQLEIYVLGHALLKLFGDDSIAKALATGDVYSAVARQCWPDALAKLTDAEVKKHRLRSDAKVVVLATNYGKTELGLAISLLDENERSVGRDYASRLLAEYYTKFPGIRRYQDHMAAYARAHGGVWTLDGFWRPITEPYRKSGARQAYNTPIQGGAAQIARRAMTLIEEDPRLNRFGAKLLMQVHDEVILEVPEEHAEQTLSIAKHHMEHAYPDLLVQLRAEGKVCDTWHDMKA